MKIKTLTIYCKYVERFIKGFIPTPEIRLTGKWVEKIGFKSGNKIAVLYQQNRIILLNTSYPVYIL